MATDRDAQAQRQRVLERRNSYDAVGARAHLMGRGAAIFRSTPNLGSPDLRHELRWNLYASLPFMAVPGMSTRTRRVVHRLSFAARQEEQPVASSFSPDDGVFVYRLGGSFEHDDVVDLRGAVVTWPLVRSAAIACIGQFLFGYNTSATNGPEHLIFAGQRTETMWAIAVAAFALGGPVGAGFGGSVANRYGRKVATCVEAAAFIVAGAWQCLSPSIELFAIGRFVCGAASGFSSVTTPVYLGEIAPPVLRGAMATASQLALVTGILAADLIAFGQGTLTWRGVFAVSPLLALIQLLLALPLLLESPRWLLDRYGAASPSARYALQRLHALATEEDIDREIEHVLAASALHISEQSATHEHGSLRRKRASNDFQAKNPLLADRHVRRVLGAVVALHLAQQLCGINAVFYYSTMFFQGIIADPLLGTTIVAAVNVLAVYVAILLLGEFDLPRKPLLAASAGGMFVASIALTLALLHLLPNIAALTAVAVFVLFFEIGLGPIPWSLVGEVFDHAHVDAAQTISCQINWLANAAVGLFFPAIATYLGPLAFLPFAIVLLATFAFVILSFPETKDASVQYIQDAFMSADSLRASKNRLLFRQEDYDDEDDLDQEADAGPALHTAAITPRIVSLAPQNDRQAYSQILDATAEYDVDS